MCDSDSDVEDLPIFNGENDNWRDFITEIGKEPDMRDGACRNSVTISEHVLWEKLSIL